MRKRSKPSQAGLKIHLDEQIMFAQHMEGKWMLAVLERLLSISLEYSQASFKNHCKWGLSITRDERRVVNNLLLASRRPLLLHCGTELTPGGS